MIVVSEIQGQMTVSKNSTYSLKRHTLATFRFLLISLALKGSNVKSDRNGNLNGKAERKKEMEKSPRAHFHF